MDENEVLVLKGDSTTLSTERKRSPREKLNRNSYWHEEGTSQNIIDLGFNIKTQRKR